MTTSKPKRGGVRSGAGRVTQDGAQSTAPRTVMLDSHTVEKARIIGSGNLSEGIRRAVSTVDFTTLQS
jgi:hypothetical protein